MRMMTMKGKTLRWVAPLAGLFLLSLSPLGATPAQEAVALTGANPPANGIWLDSLDLSKMVQRRGTPRVGKSGASGATLAWSIMALASPISASSCTICFSSRCREILASMASRRAQN